MAGLRQQIDVEIHRYDTAKDVVEAFFGSPISEASEVGGFDGDGKEYCLAPDEMVSNIRRNGCWGFARNKKEIHFWARKNCNSRRLIEMFAHEFGHLLKPHHRDEMAEEVKADRYSDAAAFAFDVMVDIKTKAK